MAAIADETFAQADRALALLKRLCAAASPHAFELCFAYSGRPDRALAEAVEGALAAGSRLSPPEAEALHRRHFPSAATLVARAEETAAGLIRQADCVGASVAAAQGSVLRYGNSLAALADDIAGDGDPFDLQTVLASLTSATREMAVANRLMQQQMTESRDEIDRLRVSLDDARRETLIDPLTGIANRRHFEAAIETAVAAAAASGRDLALIVIDIDHFKHFNDTFGHATGDQVLRLVSATMRDQVRATDTLARIGGEEFAVLLPGCGREPALARAETIRSSVMGRELLKRSTGETLGRVTVSAGVTNLRPGDSATTLTERADMCLYEAKRDGRNRVATDADEPVSNAA